MDMLLHGHHDNDNGCPISLVDSVEERAEQIVTNKPKKEIERRLSLLRVITPDMLPEKTRKAWEAYDKAEEAYWKVREALGKAREALGKAWEAYDKAREALGKAWDACDKAWEALGKAWDACDKAWEAFLSSLTPAEWEAWHRTVCIQPDCFWTAEHPSIFEHN